MAFRSPCLRNSNFTKQSRAALDPHLPASVLLPPPSFSSLHPPPCSLHAPSSILHPLASTLHPLASISQFGKRIPAGRDLELSTRAEIIPPKGESTPTRMKIFPQRGGSTPDSPNYSLIVGSNPKQQESQQTGALSRLWVIL